MKVLILLLSLSLSLSLSALGAMKKSGEIVPAFEFKDKNIIEFLSEAASILNIQFNFSKDTIGIDQKISMKINNPLTIKEFKEILYTVLSERGFTIDEDVNNYWIYSERDVRYMPSFIVAGDLGEINTRHVLYVHNLKYPVGHLISRNLRPFVSRYGRVIDIKNSNTLIISDRKTNIVKIKTIIDQMDKKLAFDNYVKEKTQAKPLRLDDYNKLLEKNKLLEISEKAMLDQLSKKEHK